MLTINSYSTCLRNSDDFLSLLQESLQPGCGIKGPSHTRIVGGVMAKPGDWPWMVNFDYKHNYANPGHHCGGSLITDEWILSAAHCFYSDLDKSKYWLVLGDLVFALLSRFHN